MRRIIFLLLMLTCFFAANIAIAATANDDDEIGDNSAKDDQQIYYLYEGIDLATTLKFSYAKPKIVIKSVYPLLHSEGEDENGNIDEEINNFNNLVLDLAQKESDDFKQRVEEQKPYQAKLPKTVTVKNDLYIDYDSSLINTKDEHILSVRFSISGMIAGSAHGFHYHRVLNYDIDTGEVLELSDIFKPDVNYLQYLSEYSRKILEKRLQNKEMIISGTEPKPENFKNWNLKPIGLVLTFDEYQVAPYVYGAQTVIIPYSALKEIIDEDSAVYGCMKNRSRCMRNKLLTGGFIDEA